MPITPFLFLVIVIIFQNQVLYKVYYNFSFILFSFFISFHLSQGIKDISSDSFSIL